MHLRDIEQFMAGHHLTYVVRNEDELDISLILEKVSKVTASSFNFKQKPTGMYARSISETKHFHGY